MQISDQNPGILWFHDFSVKNNILYLYIYFSVKNNICLSQ